MMFSLRLRIREEVKTVVSPSETVTLIVRQSIWRSISPSAMVLTDRRVIIIHHSFWGLYTKINLVSPTEINIVEHKNVMSVALGRGLFFGTIRLRIHGFVEPTLAVKYEWDLEGMYIKDALTITNEVGRLIEERSQAQDARISQTNAREGGDEDANTRRSDMALSQSHKATVMQQAENPERKMPKDALETPVAYVIKNEKVVATEKIEVPIQNSKIYGRIIGALILIVGVVGILSSLGYDIIPFLSTGAYFSLANSAFISIIGILLIKLA